MKFKKIFLHVGFDKTGSTALQKCLKINSDLLPMKNTHVPSRYSTILGLFFNKSKALYFQQIKTIRFRYRFH